MSLSMSRPRRDAVASLAGVSIENVMPATAEETRRSLAGTIDPTVLSVATGAEDGQPAHYWRVGDRYFFDDAFFGEVVAFTDLAYDSTLGLYAEESDGYGSLADDPLERLPQGQFEVREPIRDVVEQNGVSPWGDD